MYCTLASFVRVRLYDERTAARSTGSRAGELDRVLPVGVADVDVAVLHERELLPIGQEVAVGRPRHAGGPARERPHRAVDGRQERLVGAQECDPFATEPREAGAL